ncbi:EpsG family protein [Acinetobacter johnsonii]|uniref:EpsG family protein n=1 Tax=Acinetobacter johnsonii TaxID=40214 RepID=UPI003AF7A997
MNKIVILWILFLFLTFPFSPFVFFIATVFTLIFLPLHDYPFLRPLLLIFGAFSQLFIFYSIDFSASTIIDYRVYSEANEIIKSMSLSEVFYEPFGIEFGWGLIYWILNKIGIEINGVSVSYYNSIICIMLFITWFEKYGLKDIDKKYHGLVSASTLIFLSFFTITFLQRQAISVAILLFAISNQNNRKFYFFLLISSLFHITSLIVGILYKYISKINFTPRRIFYFMVCILIFRLFFRQVILFLDQFSFLTYKTSFYLSLTSFEIVSFRLALYSVMLFVIVLIFGKNINSQFKNIIYFTSICSVSLLGINLASERLNFILIYLYGYFLFLILYRKHLNLLIFLNVIFLIIFAIEKSSLINETANHWVLYPPLSNVPFYFLFN